MLPLSNEYSRIVVLRKIAKFPRQMLYNIEIIATEALSGKHADESNRGDQSAFCLPFAVTKQVNLVHANPASAQHPRWKKFKV